MMFDFLKFASPEQIKALSEIKKVTKDIRARIVTKDSSVEVIFTAESEDGMKVIPHLKDSLVQTIGTVLNTAFGVTGTIKRE